MDVVSIPQAERSRTAWSRRMANRRKLGELLVAAGVLDAARLSAALAEQKKWGGKLGRILIELGFVSEEIMVKALSHQLQLPAVDLIRDLPTSEAISRVPVQMAEKYGVFPMAYDDAKKALSVATSDPTNETNLRDLRLELNVRTVSPVVCGAHDIDRAIRRYYYGDKVEAVPTATPQHFGLSEALIDLGVPSAGVIPGRDGVKHMIDEDKLKEETSPRLQVAPPQAQSRPPSISSMPAAPSARPPPPPVEARPISNGAGAPLPPPLAQPLVPGVANAPPVLGPPSTVFTAAAIVASPTPVAANADQLAQLLGSVQRMEELLTAEVRSLRTLVEMLVEKGLVNREDYLKRVRERH